MTAYHDPTPIPSNVKVRVLLVDDHPFVRDGIKGILVASGKYEIVGEAASAASAIAMLHELRPELLITDLRLPDGDGAQVLEAAKAYRWEMYSVVLSAFENEDDIVSVARSGALAYLIKTASSVDLLNTLDRIMTGENILLSSMPDPLRERLGRRDLTGRELQALEMIGRGLSNKQIASTMQVSENTTKAHVKSIFSKLGVKTRSEAASIAARRGMR